MTSDKELSPQEQLAALGQAQAEMNRAIGYGAKLMGWYSVALGVVIGLLAAMLQYFRPDENFVGFWIIMGLYVLIILVLSLVYGKLYRSLPRGYSKRYVAGFTLSIVLYAVSVALLPLRPDHWLTALAVLVVVAAPLVITGARMVRS